MDSTIHTSGSWASAGLALGVGIVEGQQVAQRHRENLMMQQRIVNALNLRNSQLTAADQARRQAEMRLLDSMIEVNYLSEQLINSQNADRQRVARISELRETLLKEIEKCERQANEITQKDTKIADLESKVAKFEMAYREQVDENNRLKVSTSELQGRFLAMERRANQWSDLLAKSERLTKVWKDRCAETCVQRNNLQSLLDQSSHPGSLPTAVPNAPPSII